MYRYMYLSIPLALACSTPKYDYDEGDSGLTLTNSDVDGTNADEDEDADADADGSDDGSDDAGNDDDGGDDDGGDDGPPEPGDPDNCSHPYNPVDETSWEKTFSAVWVGGSATATEQGMGTGYTSTGVETFKTWDKLTTSTGEGWEGSVYHNCDNSAGTQLSVVEWNMQLTFSALPTGPSSALMMLSTPRTYLGDESVIGSGDSWSFNYDLTYVDTSGSSGGGGSISIKVPVSGTYTDKGMVEIDVLGETMDAWKIESSYDMSLRDALGFDVSSIDGLSWFTRDYPGVAEYYWVEGMGLVYEKHVDSETETIILEKTLTAAVGL